MISRKGIKTKTGYVTHDAYKNRFFIVYFFDIYRVSTPPQKPPRFRQCRCHRLGHLRTEQNKKTEPKKEQKCRCDDAMMRSRRCRSGSSLQNRTGRTHAHKKQIYRAAYPYISMPGNNPGGERWFEAKRLRGSGANANAHTRGNSKAKRAVWAGAVRRSSDRGRVVAVTLKRGMHARTHQIVLPRPCDSPQTKGSSSLAHANNAHTLTYAHNKTDVLLLLIHVDTVGSSLCVCVRV